MEPFTATLEHDVSLLRGLRHSLSSWLEMSGVAAEARAGIVLATHEAAANALRHGEGTHSPVTVTARPDGEGSLMVVVRNDGSWKEPAPEPEREGRGLPLMRGLMSDVAVYPGTSVRMRKDL